MTASRDALVNADAETNLFPSSARLPSKPTLRIETEFELRTLLNVGLYISYCTYD